MKSGGVAGAMNVEGTVGATLTTTTGTNHDVPLQLPESWSAPVWKKFFCI
jgi:hypothetical protein